MRASPSNLHPYRHAKCEGDRAKKKHRALTSRKVFFRAERERPRGARGATSFLRRSSTFFAFCFLYILLNGKAKLSLEACFMMRATTCFKIPNPLLPFFTKRRSVGAVLYLTTTHKRDESESIGVCGCTHTAS